MVLQRPVDTPVLVGILQCDGGAVAALVKRYISQLFVEAGEIVVVHIGGGENCIHGFQLQLGVGLECVDGGIHHHRNAVIAYHAPVLTTMMAPYGQHVVGASVVVVIKRQGKVTAQGGIGEVNERMQGTVGVPQREDSIAGMPVIVLFINILIDGGVYHGVVVGGVKHSQRVFRPLCLDATQHPVPMDAGQFANHVEMAAVFGVALMHDEQRVTLWLVAV